MGLTYVPVISQNKDVTFKNVNSSGTLNVVGAATLGSTLTVVGGTNLSTLTTTGNASVGGTLSVTGETTVNGLTVNSPASMNVINATQVNATQLNASSTVNTLRLTTAGGGIGIKAGTNATIGTATLAAGSATVSTTKVTATSVIFLTVQAIGTVTTPKPMTILNKNAGVSFQIVSSDATDTSTVAWWIVETA
jgi:hypothetical protein